MKSTLYAIIAMLAVSCVQESGGSSSSDRALGPVSVLCNILYHDQKAYEIGDEQGMQPSALVVLDDYRANWDASCKSGGEDCELAIKATVVDTLFDYEGIKKGDTVGFCRKAPSGFNGSDYPSELGVGMVALVRMRLAGGAAISACDLGSEPIVPANKLSLQFFGEAVVSPASSLLSLNPAYSVIGLFGGTITLSWQEYMTIVESLPELPAEAFQPDPPAEQYDAWVGTCVNTVQEVLDSTRIVDNTHDL